MRQFNRRRLLSSALAISSAATVAALAGSAGAQEKPKVLLLLDSSGYEALQPGAAGDPTGSGVGAYKCDNNNPAGWAMIAQALTGSINKFDCQDGDQLANPLHVISDKCYWIPINGGSPPGTDWETATNKAPLGTGGAGCGGGKKWRQSNNGIIDTFSKRIRFGLMTSDVNRTDTGDYSYFWGGTPASGLYAGQTAPLPSAIWEVGARSDSAPANMGRLMGFGAANALPNDIAAQNNRIQQVILATEPVYNETAPGDGSAGNLPPVAAMLKDARDFMVSDIGRTIRVQNSPPINLEQNPVGACGQRAIVLVTSGYIGPAGLFGGDMTGGPAVDGVVTAPPAAAFAGQTGPCVPGVSCPYGSSAAIIQQLAVTDGIPVYVVGVVTDDQPLGQNCTSLTSLDFAPGQFCDLSLYTDPVDKDAVLQCCNLAYLATQEVAPGTPGPLYVVNSLNKLKSALNTISLSVGTIPESQTIPAEAVAAPTLVQANNPTVTSAGVPISPSAFEVLSSFTAPMTAGKPNGKLWEGILERRRLTCNATGLVPVGDDIKPLLGDDYAQNLNWIRSQGTPNSYRNMVWNLIDYTSLGTNSYDADDTLRPNLGTTDGLGDVGTTLKAQFTKTLEQIAGNDFALPGLVSAKDLNIGSADKNTCKGSFGTTTYDRCANRTLKWLAGTNAASGFTAASNDRASLMGGFLHSSPIVVGPPLEFLKDETYRAAFAVTPAANAAGQATRPTVTYAQTTDGILHAFVTANNSAPADTKYGGTSVMKPMTKTNNELWAWVPPAIHHFLLQAANVQTTFLDGPLVASDVVFSRTQADAADGANPVKNVWNTVLVGSSGASAAGSFYYAMDITNPLQPKFLWQLKTAGSDHVNLFGDDVPAAAITSVDYKDPITNVVSQVAVAILSGGTGSDSPSGTWNAAKPEPARSVTIVRLDNGKVLKRFEGGPDDIDTNDVGLMSALRDDSNPLLAPMSGTPVPFPGTPGVSARRVYVGDQAGRMWRLDLHNPDSTQWSVAVAFDAYSVNNERQPVVIAPVLTTDLNGVPVLVYATGGQEDFSTPDPGAKNYLIRFKDDFNLTTATFQATELLPRVGTFTNGKRVSGPLSLFDSNLFFATYAPLAAGCGAGNAELWALDYITGASASIDLTGDALPDASPVAAGQSVIYGAQLSRVPGCVGGTASNITDGWLSGNYSATTNVSSAQYQLTFNGGGGTSGITNWANAGAGSAVTNLHVNMKAPKALLRIHSWASVSE